jgi:hypothetical protein
MDLSSDDYRNASFSNYVTPVAEIIGRWWRRRWSIQITEGGGNSFTIPPPVADIDVPAMFVSAWWESESLLLLDTYSRTETLQDDELIYVSVIAAWLRYRLAPAELIVQGVKGHPILTLSN